MKGHLILLAARGVSGTSTLTIRATDTEGAYVEMSTDGSNFPVYDEIRADHQGHTTLGLREMNFISEGVDLPDSTAKESMTTLESTSGRSPQTIFRSSRV